MGNACAPRLGGRGFDVHDIRQKNYYGDSNV